MALSRTSVRFQEAGVKLNTLAGLILMVMAMLTCFATTKMVIIGFKSQMAREVFQKAMISI